MDILEVLSGTARRSYVKALGTPHWVQLLPRQRVRLKGRHGDFVVLHVHPLRGVVDLLPAGSTNQVEMNIPIQSISGVTQPSPEDDHPEVA